MKLNFAALYAVGTFGSLVAGDFFSSTAQPPQQVSNVFEGLSESEVAVFNFQGGDFKDAIKHTLNGVASYSFEIGVQGGTQTSCYKVRKIEEMKTMENCADAAGQSDRRWCSKLLWWGNRSNFAVEIQEMVDGECAGLTAEFTYTSGKCDKVDDDRDSNNPRTYCTLDANKRYKLTLK